MRTMYCCCGIVGDATWRAHSEMVKIKKVIKAGIIHPTKIKSLLLNREYDNLQAFLRGNTNVELYSAIKQQAKRFYKKIKDGQEYPISIRKDLLKIEVRDTKLAKYWARIPVSGRRGGLWVAIKPHCEFPEKFEICESKLIRRGGRFFLNITVQREVEIKYPSNPSAVIAVDIGEANPVSFCLWQNGQITKVGFLGKAVRGIRAHYNQVRKSIGKKKVKHALGTIKRIGDAEKRKVRDVIHKATTGIVQLAKETGVIIVVGDLKGVRKRHRKYVPRCRKNNRKIHQMPSYQVKTQLKYKSEWAGVPIRFVNEAYTSQQCWRCGSIGKRTKRQFLCPNCGLDYNADLNGVGNILNRSLSYMLRDRAEVNQPLSSTVNYAPDEGDLKRSQYAMEEAHLQVGE